MPNSQNIRKIATRKFLLLQGPMGPFFSVLAKELSARGFGVRKINFNGGDKYFYAKASECVDFEGDVFEWQGFLADYIRKENITDAMMYGDCRPLHKFAIAVLKSAGVRVFVLEEGYFRPNWITMEENGVNYNSNLPRDAAVYAAHKSDKLPQFQQVRSSFHKLAWYVTQYYVSSVIDFNRGRYAGYQFHFGGSHHKAFLPWIPRLFTRNIERSKAPRMMKRVEKMKFFLVPLQLCRDSQIVSHSEFSGMPHFIQHVINSFAKDAQQDVNLVFKNHPLDPGHVCLKSAIRKHAKLRGVENKVFFLDGGHLPTLLNKCIGVVSVNSTLGLQAIHHEVPTLLLGRAVYDIEGLVNKLDIGQFWGAQQKPDMELYKKFRNYVMVKTQVNGGFISGQGMQLAARGVAGRIGSAIMAEYVEMEKLPEKLAV